MREGHEPKLKIRKIARVLFALAIAVVILGLAILEVRSMVKLEELKSQISYLQDTTDIIQTDVTNMESNIEATLEQESSLLETWSIEPVDCDLAQGTYDVEVSMIPKTYTDTMSASIFFGTQEYALQQDGYIYSGRITLSMDTVYDGNVTILFADGNKKTTEVLQNYQGFQTTLRDVLSGVMSKEPVYRNGELTVKNDTSIDLTGNGKFDFSQVLCVAEVNDAPVYVWDIGGNRELTSEEYQQLFSNLTAVTDTMDENDSDEAVDSDDADTTNTAGTMDTVDAEESTDTPQDTDTANGTVSQAADLMSSLDVTEEIISGMSSNFPIDFKQDVEPGSKVRIYLLAITTENDRFTYNVFQAYTADGGDGFAEAATYYLPDYTFYDDKGGYWKIK